jgi:hypothetical protein
MTATASPSENAPHWARPLYERKIGLLGDLAEEGREIARTLARRVAAVDADDSLAGAEVVPMLEGLSRAYGRASRAVRLTLMLQDRLIKDLIAFDEGVIEAAARDRRDRTRDRKELAGHIIERAIGRERNDAEEIEHLVWETSERLDREDLYGAVLSRPVSELVAMVCRDLGLDPDWSGLAGEAWAQDEAASGDVGWPIRGAVPNSLPIGEGRGARIRVVTEGERPVRQSFRQSPSTASRSPSPDGGGIGPP